jgi:hypothetical protein
VARGCFNWESVIDTSALVAILTNEDEAEQPLAKITGEPLLYKGADFAKMLFGELENRRLTDHPHDQSLRSVNYYFELVISVAVVPRAFWISGPTWEKMLDNTELALVVVASVLAGGS